MTRFVLKMTPVCLFLASECRCFPLLTNAATRPCVRQQALAGALAPRPRPGVAPGAEWNVPVPRRVARMTPLWRIMNSKPLGAYCQNNYECSTGLCR